MPEALISFEDGRAYTMLKRHLRTLGLTPEDYRAKWGLQAEYPMVAPNYSAKRSEVARAAGLGTRTRRVAGGAARKAR
jgi:predicted transcriptional regulator